MRPILFSIGDVNIYSYGLMLAIAAIAAITFAEKYAAKKGLDKDLAFNLGIICVISGVLGAKILYWITIIPQFVKDFMGTLKNSLSEGFVVYGGVIVGILVGLIICLKHKKNFFRYFDVAVIAIALGQAFGRVGCFLAGCCYGVPTDSWIGITFPAGSFAPSGVPLVPVQLISVAANLLHFGILLFCSKKFKTPGRVGALYVILYSIGRFIIEFWRVEPTVGSTGLSNSQFISVITLPIGIILMILVGRLNKLVKVDSDFPAEEPACEDTEVCDETESCEETEVCNENEVCDETPACDNEDIAEDTETEVEEGSDN
ncbi:MAG: prolipoprotein diacylglyceryl transferase [Lachnospiraceae bacterium]|nr:prolipoprotein diacylglyceryl transferase [Candidatus Minthocola equi]